VKALFQREPTADEWKDLGDAAIKLLERI